VIYKRIIYLLRLAVVKDQVSNLSSLCVKIYDLYPQLSNMSNKPEASILRVLVKPIEYELGAADFEISFRSFNTFNNRKVYRVSETSPITIVSVTPIVRENKNTFFCRQV